MSDDINRNAMPADPSPFPPGSTIFGREPSLIAGFVQAVILCAMAFGFDVTTDQLAAIMVVVTLGLALLVRRVVTPVSRDART